MKSANPESTATRSSCRLALVCLAAFAASSAYATPRYFDAGVSTPLTWDQGTTANWSTSAAGGPYNTLWVSYDTGFFKGTAGTLAVGNVQTNGLTFQTDGYVLNGGTITTGSPVGGTLLSVGTGITATIASNIAQTSLGMSKTGAGTLILSGTSINTTGGTGESFRVLGGTVNVTGQVYSDERSIRVDGAGVLLKVAGTGRIYHSTYSGGGALTVQNGATVELENWGYGETTLSLGGLRAGANAVIINNGTIRIVGTTATNYERGFTVQSGGATFDAATGANWTLAVGSPAINYAVTYTGNPSLAFTGAGTGRFDKVFSGTGGLSKSGGGTWTLGATNTYTGATNINAGTLNLLGGAAIADTGAVIIANVAGATLKLSANETIGSLAGGGITGGTVDLQGNTLTTGNAATTTFAGGITGSGGSLVKQGVGAFTLGGTNTYTGTTTVNAGRLNLASTSNASDIIVNNATLGGEGSTSGSLTFNTGATLAIDFNSFEALTTTGAVDFAAPTMLAVDFSSVAGSGTVDVLYYGSLANFANLQMDAPGYRSPTLTNEELDYKITLTINTAARTWNANSSGDWDAMSSDNWAEGDFKFAQGDAVTFDDTATDSNVNLVGSLLPSSIAVTNSVLAYTFSGTGTISGSTGLTKTGTAPLTIANANNFTGATLINGGVINIQNASALGSTAVGTTVADGAAMTLTGGIITDAEPLTLNGTGIALDGALRSLSGDNTFSGMLTLGSAARIQADAGTLTLSHAGTITGATFGLTVGGAGNTILTSIIGTTTGTLTKEGTGTLTLGAANTYTGATTIKAGTLAISSDGNLGVAPGAAIAGKIVLDGGTLNVTANNVTINSNRGLLVGPSGGTITTPNAIQKTTYKSVITGSGSLVINGTGDVDIQAASPAFSGGVTLNGVRVSGATSSQCFGTGPVTITGTATSGGQLYADGNATWSNNFFISGMGGNTNDSTPRGAIRVDYAAKVSGIVTLTANAGIGATFGTGTISGKITGAFSLSITNSGTSTLVLSGANDYTGPTLLNAGTLDLAGGAAIVNTGSVTISNVAGATLKLSASETIGSLTGGALSAVNLQANTLTTGDATDSSFAGIINGTGGLTKQGVGNFSITGANTYTGATNVNGGILTINGNQGAATGAVTVTNAGSTLAGTGTVGGVTTVTTDAVLSPAGAATGTLSFKQNVILDGAVLAAGITGVATNDVITLDTGKTLDLGTSTVKVTLSGHTPLLGETFDLVNADTITGIPVFDFSSAVLGGGLAWDTSAFTTTGVISVVSDSPGNSYANWAATNTTPGDGPEDDSDGDGVPNGVEYVLGGGNSTNDLDALPDAATDGTNMTFTFVRDQASIGADTAVTIEVGTTMITWPDVYPVPDAAVANNPGVTVVDNLDGTDTVTLTVPMSPDAAKFARLVAIITPPAP